MTEVYPLVFEPILRQKVWGGRRLERLGKRLDEASAYGESWEIADLASTSAGGGGGGAAISVVAGGAADGRTIGDLVVEWGVDLLGERGMERAAEFGESTGAGRPVFPLLLKYLDAREHLSVQVHPSPRYCAEHPGAHLKTESWYVVDAERAEMPGGGTIDPVVFKGMRAGLGREAFAELVRTGEVASALAHEPAVPGVCHTLPSGTLHALGGGVLVAEVQTPSDTTFRVYDWTAEYPRPERELHVEQAMACLDFENPSTEPAVDATRGGRAAWTDYYTIDAVRTPATLEPGEASAVMVIGGAGRLAWRGGERELAAGETVLVPASVSDGASLEGDGLHALVIGIA
jgi:mannose-6-phosphate isomerase